MTPLASLTRRAALMALAPLVLLFAAAPAFASSVAVSGSTISYTAASGETNNLTVTLNVDGNGTEWVVYDENDTYGPGTAVPISTTTPWDGTSGCQQLADVSWWECAVQLNDPTALTFDLGDMNDTLEAEGDVANPIDIDETVDGGDGNDQLRTGQGNDTINGDAGWDVIDGDMGDDVMSGGADEDRVSYGSHTDGGIPVTASLGGGSGNGDVNENDTIDADVEDLQGGAADDDLSGDDGDNLIMGGPGNDSIDGAGGSDDLEGQDGGDNIHGGDGNDSLQGAAGADSLHGDAGDDIVDGGDDNDFLYGDADDDVLLPGPGDDTFQGGDGWDQLSYGGYLAPVTVTMGDDTANDGNPLTEQDNVYDDIESLTGTSYADSLTGGPNVDNITGDPDTLAADPGDTLNGGGGGDTLNGGAGDDVIHGDADNDYMWPGGGNNQVFGDAGRDTLIEGMTSDGSDDYSGGADTDFVDYSGRTAPLSVSLDDTAGDGEAGENDNIHSDVEVVQGGQGDDTLTGSSGNDTLIGNGGDDHIDGGAGDDELHGGGQYSSAGVSPADSDVIEGGPGNDLVDGGFGTDTIDGGADSDTVAYWRDSAVNVSLDGVDNDGGPGEDDHLVSIEGVQTGDGDDTIDGRDGQAEYLDCGAGNDVAHADDVDGVDPSCESSDTTVTGGGGGGGGGGGDNPTAPVATGAPAISGTPRDGQRLTVSPGSWSGSSPITLSYRWQRCDVGGGCSAIAGATSRGYTATAADVGRQLLAVVHATNSVGATDASSARTAAVAGTGPVNTAAPVIAGTPKEGATLTVTAGTWTGTGPFTITHQWERCSSDTSCTPIVGATGDSYRVGYGDIQSSLRVSETLVSPWSGGPHTVTSALTGYVTNPAGTTARMPMPTLTPKKKHKRLRFVTYTLARQQLDALRQYAIDHGFAVDLDVSATGVPRRKVPSSMRSRVRSGYVVSQTPAPGTELLSGGRIQASVKLNYYDPLLDAKPRGRKCDFTAAAQRVKGQVWSDDFQRELKKWMSSEHCDYQVEQQFVRGDFDPTVAGVKVKHLKRYRYLAVTVKWPKGADLALDIFTNTHLKNDLGIMPDHTSGGGIVHVLAADGRHNYMAFTVHPVQADGSGLSGITVTVDASDVGAPQDMYTNTTDAKGDASFRFMALKSGVLKITAVGGPTGADVEGWTTIKVEQQTDSLITLGTGRTLKRTPDGYVECSCAGSSRAVMAGGNVFTELWDGIVSLFSGTSAQGTVRSQQASKPSQSVSNAYKSTGVVDGVLAKGGSASAPATPPVIESVFLQKTSGSGGDATTVSGSGVTVAPDKPKLAITKDGNVQLKGNGVIAAGGGNVIAAGGGNVIAAGGGNVIAAGGGNVIAAGGGNVIAAGGGNVIAAGGGNVIAAGGGN